MTGRSPFLSLAIEGRIGPDGTLWTADPHLMRLHKANGGVEDGILAIPPLLALAKLAWQTGAKLERSVVVADGDRDAELWIRAVRRPDHICLSILGWQDAMERRRPYARITPSPSQAVTVASDMALILDAKSVIISIAPDFLDLIGLASIGRPFTSALRQPEQIDLEELCTSASDGLIVQPIGSDGHYRLTVSRLVDPDQGLLGFECKLKHIEQAAAVSGAETKSANIGFGRQFATAVRQPLSRIIANAETIGAHINGPIKQNYAGYAQDIASAARHLSELVSDLEDLDAIDRVDFKVASEKVELGDIARRVAGLLALKAADHRIAIELPMPDEKVEVLGEFRRILQIVLNLTGNAIRYAPDGSVVRIGISANPPQLSVSDQGRGIPEEDRERVFEKFERLGRSGDGGSGLGLYISRRLARAMTGDLIVEESAEGGAMFLLSLPPFKRN